jgi:putative flippase GtrA
MGDNPSANGLQQRPGRNDGLRTGYQALGFLVIGGACYALGLATLIALVSGLGVHYLPANLLALVVSYPAGYLLNRRWNFRSRRPVGPEMRRYVLANAITFAAAFGSIAVMVEFLHAHYVAANLIATAGQTVANFALAKWWVFTAAPAQATRS